MEYASIIWDPHFIKDRNVVKPSNALERVQRRAARRSVQKAKSRRKSRRRKT